MKIRLHLVALLAFVVSLLFNLVFWGAVKDLPDVGSSLRHGAERSAPLALSYMFIGEQVDAIVPPLQRFGLDLAGVAFAEGTQRMKDDPNVALVLAFERTWNGTHRMVKFFYWACPVFGVLALILWLRRPKKVRMMGRR